MGELYYRYAYPASLIWRWLSFDATSKKEPIFPVGLDFKQATSEADTNNTNREIGFTFEDGVYSRHNSYESNKTFRANLIAKKDSTVVQIGAIYSKPPIGSEKVNWKTNKKERDESVVVLARELVFDVDISDYGDLIKRTCCGDEKKVCQKCWIILYAGMRVLDNILRENFGFKQIYFFYSGMKGFHCWVMDVRARVLAKEAREAIVDYITRTSTMTRSGPFLTRITQPVKRYDKFLREHVLEDSVTYAMSPDAERDFLVLLPLFCQVCQEHGLCRGPNGYNAMLRRFLKDEQDRKELELVESQLPAELTGHDKCLFGWLRKKVDCYRSQFEGVTRGPNRNPRIRPYARPRFSIMALIPNIVFSHLHPKLDKKVTTQMEHLIKSPFSVHQTSKRIAVPLSLDAATFDPAKVPTVGDIEKELIELENPTGDGDWKQTSMFPLINKFVDNIRFNCRNL